MILKEYKKAAMFGLDARIALAIFGALSVITGAALYSAIQKAKVIAVFTEVQEIAKSFEAFYLDTRKTPTKLDNSNYATSELVNSSVKGWSGPYLPYALTPLFNGDATYSNKFLDYNRYEKTYIMLSEYKSSNFSATSGSNNLSLCSSDDDCSLYVTISQWAGSEGLKEMTTDIDNLIDGGDGLATGSIRGFAHGTSGDGTFQLFYKIMDKRSYL